MTRNGPLWEQADRIKMFTIAAADDIIPWELLYPANGNNDKGVLAEQFPVVRRVHSRERVSALPISSAAYVLCLPNSPTNARAEVDAISAPLVQQIVNRGTISDLPGVSDLMLSRDLPSIIHFAGHNTFSNEAGPSISLEGGLWEPSDLALAVMRTSLAQVHPPVFLNACRSAGEIPWFFQMSRMGTGISRGWCGSVHRFVVGCAVKLRRDLARGLLRTVRVQWPVTGQRVACPPAPRCRRRAATQRGWLIASTATAWTSSTAKRNRTRRSVNVPGRPPRPGLGSRRNASSARSSEPVGSRSLRGRGGRPRDRPAATGRSR